MLILNTTLRNLILTQLQQLLISIRKRCPSPLLDLLPISIALDGVIKRADSAACQPATPEYFLAVSKRRRSCGLTEEHRAYSPLPFRRH